MSTSLQPDSDPASEQKLNAFHVDISEADTQEAAAVEKAEHQGATDISESNTQATVAVEKPEQQSTTQSNRKLGNVPIRGMQRTKGKRQRSKKFYIISSLFLFLL